MNCPLHTITSFIKGKFIDSEIPNFNFDSNSRYMLGTFYGTTQFQLLSGLYVGRQKEPYSLIFLTITSFISTVALICMTGKKIKERYKDKKLLQQINIQIPNPPAQFQYNNEKNNVSLLNVFEMTLLVGIMFLISLLLLVYFLTSKDEISYYWVEANHLELVTSIIFKVINPIIYLVIRKDVRNFIQNTISNFLQIEKH